MRKTCLMSALLLLLAAPQQLVPVQEDLVPPPGEFTFVRIKFKTSFFFIPPGYEEPWHHDYPRAENHLVRALREFTNIDASDEGVILELDDPRLFKYPFAYICEVGFWSPTDSEAANLREWLERGGFLVVDDFSGGRDWLNFLAQVRRIFPEKRVEPLSLEHPIFHSFFDIDSLDFYSYRGQGMFYGLSDDKGRLMMIINVNNDLGEYWEYADLPYMPLSMMNQAFKLGINYIVYAMTH